MPLPLQWVTINDFTPGIAEDPGAKYPPGQATIANTYRCISDRGGALVPFARVDFQLTGRDNAPSNPAASIISGFYVPPLPVIPNTPGAGVDSDARYHEFWIGYDFTQNDGFRHNVVERIRQFEPVPTREVITSITVAESPYSDAANGMWFGTTRVNRASPLTPGLPVVVYSWQGLSLPPGISGYIYQFPDDATPTLNTPFVIKPLNTNAPPHIVTHQNRVVNSITTGYGHGVGTVGSTGEDLQWTNVNNTGVFSVRQAFVPEAPNGYQLLAPMSADELFCLKENFAVVFRGDLDDPTIVNLPMVAGTNKGQTPAVTPLGLVYGSPDSGVWVWAHGDTSVLLSPMMSPGFWRVPREWTFGSAYSFESWDDWVMVPNNYVFDTQLKSWWRSEDPANFVIHKYGRFRHFMYGAISRYSGTAPIVYGWNRERPALSYKWTSHPFWKTLDHRIDVRSVSMRVKGKGSVTVQVIGQNGAAQQRTWTFNNNVPELVRDAFSVQCDNCFVSITSLALSDSTAAPTVYELNIGYHDAPMVPNTGEA